MTEQSSKKQGIAGIAENQETICKEIEDIQMFLLNMSFIS